MVETTSPFSPEAISAANSGVMCEDSLDSVVELLKECDAAIQEAEKQKANQ